MVEYAKQHYYGVIYKLGRMQNMNYHNKFDAIICIFSTIVFNKSNEEVIKTLTNFYKALKNNGILIIETFNSINWVKNNLFKNRFVDINKENNESIVQKKENIHNNIMKLS